MPRLAFVATILAAALVTLVAAAMPAAARSCADLRALCWTMRTDKSDCTMPYRRCLQTGVFVTPLGRRFVATSR